MLWLPLGDSITFGCTGPTIEDCHGYPHGHDTGLVRSLLLSLLSLLLSHSSPLSSLPLPFLCSCITLRSQCLPGQYCSSGYRIPLALALSEPPCGGCPYQTNGGWNITTMGTFSTGPSYTPTQWHRHEGHPGWTINMVDNILNESLKTSHTPPDLITIHLGTTRTFYFSFFVRDLNAMVMAMLYTHSCLQAPMTATQKPPWT